MTPVHKMSFISLMINVPTLYLGVLGSLEPSPWSLSGSDSGLSTCTFRLSWEESNGVSEIVGSANGGGTDAGGAEIAESPDFSAAPADGGVDVEGGWSADGVAVDVSVVANAISPFLGDCPGSSWGDFLEGSECPGRFWDELPDISDALTIDPTDIWGGGIAVVVALEVSAGAGPKGGGVVDGDGVEVSGGQTDWVVVEVSGIPGGSVPMFGFNMPRLLLYSFLWIKEWGVDVCEIADPAMILFQNVG